MAPKRARPAFSPPRPKSKSTTKTPKSISKSKPKPKSKRPSTSTTATNKRRRRDDSVSEQNSSDEDGRPSALDLVDMAASEGDDDAVSNASNDDTESQASIPSEPDAILAEVTHTSTSITSDNLPIPTPLVHRILMQHFSKPDATKISGDAREVLGKYVEVFVREAIMRCAFEREEREGSGRDGWLEVGDLERVAVQLCLDF